MPLSTAPPTPPKDTPTPSRTRTDQSSSSSSLFYRPPITSPASTTFESTPTPRRGHESFYSYASSLESGVTPAFMAHLPPMPMPTIITARSPFDASSALTDLQTPVTPPPLPPKPLPLSLSSITPKSTTSTSANTDSIEDQDQDQDRESTEHGTSQIQTQTAIRGRRASASSHHILTQPSLVSLANAAVASNNDGDRHAGDAESQQEDGTQRDSVRLAAALAKLPWAEPPVRQPSPLLSTSTSRALTPNSALGSARTPTYSFLASDPVALPPTNTAHSRRSSRASSISSSTSKHKPSPLPLPLNNDQYISVPRAQPSGVPMSPSLLGHNTPGSGWDDRRLSALSGWSGMADAPTPSFGAAELPINLHANSNDSPQSAMATKPSSSANGSGNRFSFSSTFSKKSRSTTTTRTKSTKSTKSTRSTRRGSTSTINHGRFAGRRWEVIRETRGAEERGEEVKSKEEMMELAALVGRAAFLERMLRSGRRISNQSIHHKAHLSLSSIHQRLASMSSSAHAHHRSSPSLSQLPTSSSSRHKQKEKRLSSKSVNGAGAGGGRQKRRSGSTAPSLRQRLSRKLQRSRSREDIFTELGDTTDDDDDDPSLFPDPTTNIATGGERVGGKGVLVFPEEVQDLPPTVPDKEEEFKPALLSMAIRGGGGGCTSLACISPASPTPLLPYSQEGDVEKGLGNQDHDYERDQGQGRRRYDPQSPHLGHRSPNWRNRQSVISYLSTGQWDKRARKKWGIAVGIGAVVGVIVIIGLLVGLLTRRKDGGTVTDN